jgi:transposase-like protein
MIEIITGRERRRRWGVTEKLRIVAASQESGARICDVAARHDVSPSLLHGWRRLAREGRLGRGDAMDIVPVRLASSVSDVPAPRLLRLQPRIMGRRRLKSFCHRAVKF